MLGAIELPTGGYYRNHGSNLIVLAEVRSVTCIASDIGGKAYSFRIGFRNISEGLTVDGFGTLEAAQTAHKKLLDAVSEYFAQRSSIV